MIAEPYTFVILDAYTGLDGLLPKASGGTPQDLTENFLATLARPIAEKGACVVFLDHVPKNSENANGYGLGSIQKTGGLDGTAYLIETKGQLANGDSGQIRCRKDRHGVIAKATTDQPKRPDQTWLVAEFTFGDINDSEMVVVITPPSGEGKTNYRIAKMEEISRVLEKCPEGLSLNQLKARISSAYDSFRKAIGDLVTEGYATEKPGERNAIIVTSVRPYRAQKKA